MAARKAIRETNLPLLHDAQSYLKLILEEKAPDSVLTLAWKEFYRVYDDLIRRFAFAQGVPPSDVDDCVQEVWSEVVTRLVEFDRSPQRPGLRSWLYTLVRNKAADSFRRKARQPAASLDQAQLAGQEPREQQADPASVCEEKWETALLESLMAKLRENVSETNYSILHMRMVEGRSVQQVAAHVKLTPEQVRYRHHRAMRKLRAYVAVFTGEPFGS